MRLKNQNSFLLCSFLKRRQWIMGGFLKRRQWKLKRCVLQKRRLSDLPIECIAQILSFTSPRQVCVLSLVSRMFKSAAEFDLVWEKFLPLGYKDIISKFSLDINCFSSNKKDIFHHLCTAPILIDGGNKSLTIDSNGTINLMIGSRELVVNWNEHVQWEKSSGRAQSFQVDGSIMEHCRWLHVSNSRFSYAFEFITNHWDKISGKIDVKLLSPTTNYSVYVIFKYTKGSLGFKREAYDRVEACMYGLARGTVNFVSGAGVASGETDLYLQSDSRLWDKSIEPTPVSKRMIDTWLEVKLGHFYNDKGDDGEVLLIFSEDMDYWKSKLWMTGLIVQGIEIRCDDGEDREEEQK